MSSIYELNKDYAELSAMLEAAETPEEIEAIQKANEIRKNKDVEMIPWNRDAWEVRQ